MTTSNGCSWVVCRVLVRRREIVAQLCAGAEGLPRRLHRALCTCAKTFAELELAHGDGRFARLFRTLIKADLLILDDWGPDRLTGCLRLMNSNSSMLIETRR